MHPLANPELEVYPFDSGSQQEGMLCEVPAQGGRLARFSIPGPIVELVRRCDGRTSIEDLIAAHRREHGEAHSEEQLKRLFSEFLVPNGLVSPDPDSVVAVPEKRRSFLHVQLPFLSARRVDPIARRLSWLFTPVLVVPWVALLVVCHAYFLTRILPASDLNFNALDSTRFLTLMAFTTLSALMHEFGHAAAAARYGCKGFQIGWGLYLYFTVFYADVSEAWRLPRRQRAIVDLGGVYFQALFLVPMCIGWALSGDSVFAYGFLITSFALVTALNPFLRLDGYWLVSDIAGIPNLRRTSLRFFLDLATSLRCRTFELPRIGLRPLNAVALAVYSVVGFVFFVWMASVMVDRIAFTLIKGYPPMVAAVVEQLSASPRSWPAVLSAALELLWRTVILLGLGILLARVARPAGRWLVARLHRNGSERLTDRTAVQ